jgi:hypothetical protein
VTSSVNLGQCWGTPSGSDLSSPSYLATGNLCVAEAVLRRWSTGAGQLIDDPTYGYNLSDLISDDLSPSDLAYAQQQAAAQAELDERVLQATVALTLSVAGALSVVAYLVTAAGPFKLVASVSAVGTQLLLVSP